jgi:hypothetical protein
VSPATLDFGTVTRGERAERVVVVRNPGRVSLTVREVVFDGGGAAQFQLGEAEPATVTLTGPMTTVTVRVDAESGASTTCTLMRAAAAGWAQQASLEASNLPAFLGASVAVSGDGSTVAVGERGDPSGVPGINVQPDHSAPNAGAVDVFTR